MLHYEALEQLCRDRMQQRRRDAEADRLALQARGELQPRRSARAAGVGLLLRARALAPR